MGLITKEVEVVLNPRNIKHFEEKGYVIPKVKNKYYKMVTQRGTKIKVKVCDLVSGSSTTVEMECDYCNNVTKMDYSAYTYNYLNKNYYCKSCSHIVHTENRVSSLIKRSLSFAQWGVNNLGEDFLEKYWDYNKNTLDPFKITYGSNKKVWIKCQEKDYHESYDIRPNSFQKGCRCKYCSNSNGLVHIKDSLGFLCPEVMDIWSNKNTKTPFEYTPNSGKSAWFKCKDGKHEDYLRVIKDSNNYNFRCPECSYSKGESKIYDYLIKNNYKPILQNDILYTSNKNCNYCFIPQKEFDGLYGLSNGKLSYDFYLPTFNLLIEYQGEYHDGTVPYQTDEEYKKQKEHDRRKRQYTSKHNIKLLEIWYWDFDNIGDILNKELGLLSSSFSINKI